MRGQSILSVGSVSPTAFPFQSQKSIGFSILCGQGICYLSFFVCCPSALIVSKYASSTGERVLLNLSEFPTSHSVLSGCSEFPNYHIFVKFFSKFPLFGLSSFILSIFCVSILFLFVHQFAPCGEPRRGGSFATCEGGDGDGGVFFITSLIASITNLSPLH